MEHTQAMILGKWGNYYGNCCKIEHINPSMLEHLILFKYPADGGDLYLNVQKLHVCRLKIITYIIVDRFCSTFFRLL
jgi:hypothetical protein